MHAPRRTITPRTTVATLKREAKRWLAALRAGDVAARTRLELVWPDADADLTLRDVQHALAREHGLAGWTALLDALARRPASLPHESADAFLALACLDWRVGGAQRAARMHDAARLLARDPSIARANLHTAVACGELGDVARILAADPTAANTPGGPRDWPPLLHLCTARLPLGTDNAVAIAQLLLDHGADPNAFYPGGSDSIRYSALTCVVGRGEEQAATHPQAPALVDLLMARGAAPYDVQVLYNVFANHASRNHLGDDIVWLLDLMYAHSTRLGRASDWNDPTWRMLDMGGYGHGAYYLLLAAVQRDLRGLAEWLLAHGASPNAPLPDRPNASRRSLYEEAIARGHTAMADLLVRHGATIDTSRLTPIDAFVAACLRLDRAEVQAQLRVHPEYLAHPRALHEAAEQDRDDVVALLLDLGVSTEVTGPPCGGGRPLHGAAYHGALRAAALLIARGAEVDAVNPDYSGTPLGAAAFGQQTAMVELLSRYSRDVWELTYSGHVDRLRAVLHDTPALATVTSSDDDTPLMWLPNDADAALAIVDLLVAHGADPARRNARGLTAADVAASRGLDAVVAALRVHGG